MFGSAGLLSASWGTGWLLRSAPERMFVFAAIAIALAMIPFVVGTHEVARPRSNRFHFGHVLRKLTQGTRFLRDTEPDPTPTAGAFSYRRYQLGARPLVALFHAVCRPRATF